MSAEAEPELLKAKAREEGWKLIFDLYKHIATISAGSILLIATFYEKIIKDPNSVSRNVKFLVQVSLIGFIGSILTSTVVMYFYTKTVRKRGEGLDKYRSEKDTATVLCIIFFRAGIISLAIFTIANI